MLALFRNTLIVLFGVLGFLLAGHWNPDSGTYDLGLQSAQAQTVQYIYDENGRLTGVVAPSGNAAQYNYDAAGNISSITTSISITNTSSIRPAVNALP